MSGQLRQHFLNDRPRVLLWQDCFHHRCRRWYWTGQCYPVCQCGSGSNCPCGLYRCYHHAHQRSKGRCRCRKASSRDHHNPGNLPEAEIQSPSLAAKDIERWRLTWESHIKGTYSVARALIPLLLQGTDKTVVNVTSIGLPVATLGARRYQLSRQSIESLSEDLVLTCGKEGLLAYSMCAGPKTMYENSRFANDEGTLNNRPILTCSMQARTEPNL
jgi:hypothetical protein